MTSDKRVKRKHKTRISDKECFNSAKRLQSHNEQLNYSRDGHWGDWHQGTEGRMCPVGENMDEGESKPLVIWGG